MLIVALLALAGLVAADVAFGLLEAVMSDLLMLAVSVVVGAVLLGAVGVGVLLGRRHP